MIRTAIAIAVLALCGNPALCADLEPVDYQAALIEANSQIAGLSNRAQQLAIQIAQQNREIAKLKTDAKSSPDHKDAPHP